MAKITIDNREFEVDGDKNLLETALSLGYDLPYFCWHPCLNSVGACRQCAVKSFRNEDDEKGSIVMACMTPAADGARIALNDADAVNFRAQVIEWLMINHPHDCPVCEEGGECHLQDMTLMTGHTYRRYRGNKRTHRNQYLGPFISHEMNRCIACYRCTRYYRDYAGGEDLETFAAHDHVYFGRYQEGTLESEFSGNLVEVCPTGVFTDKTLGARYTRKWDMQNSPGICGHCSLGCNTSPGARDGVLKRIQNRYHGEINHYFLCDRGRFGAGFVNREDRPRQPLLRAEGNGLQPADLDAARDRVRDMLANANGIVGIGSPRASLESNYALRHLVGAGHYSTGMAADEQAVVTLALQLLREHPGQRSSLRAVEDCDAILVLGEDVTNHAPRLALSLRQAVRRAAHAQAKQNNIPAWHDRAVQDIGGQHKHPLYCATPTATKLDSIAAESLHARPAQIAALGFAVAHALDKAAPAPGGLDNEMANTIAAALQGAQRPLVVAGTGCNSPAILRAAANVARALGDKGGLFLTLPECNSAGAALLGGLDVDQALAQLMQGAADTLVVMENDLYQRAPKSVVDEALKRAKQVVVLDHSMQATIARAHAVLPAGSFAEASGTLVNNEGRAQRFFQLYVPDTPIQESWYWISELAAMIGSDAGWQSLDQLIAALGTEVPELAAIADAAPDAGFRRAGMRVPRAPARYSGRTALYANESVHERVPTPDADSALAYSMEGWPGQRPAALLPFAWSPGWNSNQQAISKFQDEVAGPLRGGNPGTRLLEQTGDGGYQTATVEAEEGWLAVPLYHIFGSEPQSALAPAVAERVPSPYLALNPDDASGLGLAEGTSLQVTLSGEQLSLPLRLIASLPAKTLGVPAGLEGLAGIRLPQKVAL
ncbi:MAG: NADH-quinone oxidoreductase subunit NuoG [Salinisphaera sp.]|nr:NADH-quinone oxidoreductase subunit NuoG [Salinisphaera sp.]